MNIQDALDKSKKIVIPGSTAERNYASIGESGRLRWYYKRKDAPNEGGDYVSLDMILSENWQPYHEVKEIRPYAAGELWEMSSHAKFFVIADESSGVNKLCGLYGDKICIREDIIHGKDWVRLYPPVEDENVERIEIEGVEIESCCDDIIIKTSSLDKGTVFNKCKAKVTIEIPKDKP